MPDINSSVEDVLWGGGRTERAASLNADGTLNWFIPPYIIPALITLLIAARAFWLS